MNIYQNGKCSLVKVEMKQSRVSLEEIQSGVRQPISRKTKRGKWKHEEIQSGVIDEGGLTKKR